MYCRKEMVKILNCCLIPKKSYGTLSKGAFFLANPVYLSFKFVNLAVICLLTISKLIFGWQTCYNCMVFVLAIFGIRSFRHCLNYVIIRLLWSHERFY